MSMGATGEGRLEDISQDVESNHHPVHRDFSPVFIYSTIFYNIYYFPNKKTTYNK